MDIKTVTGKDQCDTTTIQKMLKNEKYKGDTLLQKTYTEDFMMGKKVENTGQRTQYFVSESHPAIVTAEIFDRVQEEMAKRSKAINTSDGTLSQSGNKYNGKHKCPVSPTIYEEWIKEKMADIVCGELYDEKVIRERIEQISVYQKYIVIKGKTEEEWMLHLKNLHTQEMDLGKNK